MRSDVSGEKDEEIVHQVQSGKIDFFGILVDRYEAKIRRYARKFLSAKEDIKDIIQEIFIKTYTNIQSFDTKRKFSSWIYRIAHNELINALKKKKKKALPLSLFDPDIFFPHSLRNNYLNQQINRQDIQKMIDKCLDQLEPKYREPIILYYFEGLSYQEIADVIQVPISTVGVRMKRAKETMKPIFKKLGYNL